MARCLVRGCPFRFRTGADGFCAEHAGDEKGMELAAEALGIDLAAIMATPAEGHQAEEVNS